MQRLGSTGRLLLLTSLLLGAAAAANRTELDDKTGWPRCEPGGWYTVSHAVYCDRYYTCQHGAPFLGQCEDGLAYQSRAGCRMLHLVDCKGRPKLQPARGHGDCLRLNGVYGGACTAAYTLCVSGMATPATCAHGYLFDNAAKSCRRPRNAQEQHCAQGPQQVDTRPGVQQQVAPDTTPTPVATTTTTPQPAVSSGRPVDTTTLSTQPASNATTQETATQPPPPSDQNPSAGYTQQPYYPDYYYYLPYYYTSNQPAFYSTNTGQAGQQQPYNNQYQTPTTTQEPYYLYYTQPYYTDTATQYYWSALQNGDWYSSPLSTSGQYSSLSPSTGCATTPSPIGTRSPAILVSGFLDPVQSSVSVPPPVKSNAVSQLTTCTPDAQGSSIPGFSCPANNPFPYGDHSRHAFPGSCRLFIMCLRDGSHKVGGCPPGYAFNAESRNCEVATAVPGCSGRILGS
ncbi:uncharacterized protein LOC124594635 [Schistocerca americana]|uniref:uncharacterized protein LOC124594635 n=1 Tax=Schistocerca americana TaxID=7009 RepID=UPI001F4F66A4|nr:uncharacterized protein LOC124594635 [Schistocerca americana]